MTQAMPDHPATPSSASVQSDQMLWSMLCTRRRRKPMPRGLDAAANRWLARLRHGTRGMGHLRREAEAVAAMEKRYADLGERALDERIADLRSLFVRRRQGRDELREGLAAIREVARRTIGQLPYPVQLMGALGLYHGQIVEMKTGEGKTLTATVAATLLGWCGRPVHVFTVNDYLAERDAASRNPIYKRCGLRAAALTGEMEEADRLKAYQCPILYAAAREVMGDWLRDQLKLGRRLSPVAARWLQSRAWGPTPQAGPAGAPPTLVPGLFVAVVDEIDAILIDEAVTPLIIAHKTEENPQEALYRLARRVAADLRPRKDFQVFPTQRQARLTTSGRQRVADWAADDHDADRHPVWQTHRMRRELVEQALVAEHCYLAGHHYQVIEEQVMIVDEYTGRLQPDRHWQNGLHQAVEAKHDLPITGEQRTLASISFQRFFRQYELLAGMTGTAAEARPEMERTYGLPVRIVPTNRPIQRRQLPERIFARAEAKWLAVADRIVERHATGQPVLAGVRSVAASQRLSDLLASRGLGHQVLSAIHHKQEARIIAAAGNQHAITIATNMAGRGTDIELGRGVAELGGLHVILTERHNARRVDRQFIGRAGRQGDPGSAQIFSSIEDDLLVKWLPWAARLLKTLYGMADARRELPRWTRRLFDLAQRRATTQAARTRLMMIRQDHDLEQSLPG